MSGVKKANKARLAHKSQRKMVNKEKDARTYTLREVMVSNNEKNEGGRKKEENSQYKSLPANALIVFHETRSCPFRFRKRNDDDDA
jgi:hypothetical protein